MFRLRKGVLITMINNLQNQIMEKDQVIAKLNEYIVVLEAKAKKKVRVDDGGDAGSQG